MLGVFTPNILMRDPIHGFIKLSKTERDLIDTKVFQRLRRIRQLAMTFLVYPGAVHTRFDHSIGVMHIAGRICTRLQELNPSRISDEDMDRVRIAALLHDVGHGPFSHVSEHLLKKYAPADSDTGQILEKIHEKITVDIIRTDSEINGILSPDERDFVVEIIEGKQNIRDWHRDVVSSELDADKMDYLLRDSYFAGVKYGIYDLEKIIESCLIEVDKTETSLAINSKGIYALEQLLLARYHMTRQVYWHRVSLISNEMIIRGITLAIEEGNTKMKELYQYDENDKENFIQKYLNYHDENVVDILRNCPQEKAQAIFSRLYGRKLFKTVANLRLKDETNIRVKRRLLTMKDDPQLRLELETAVADYLGIDADYVIIKPLQIRNPNYGSRSYILNPEAITIVDEWSSEPRAMSDYTSELFFARPLADDETSLEMVQVYVPPEGDNLSQKQRRLALEPEIQNILRSA